MPLGAVWPRPAEPPRSKGGGGSNGNVVGGNGRAGRGREEKGCALRRKKPLTVTGKKGGNARSEKKLFLCEKKTKHGDHLGVKGGGGGGKSKFPVASLKKTAGKRSYPHPEGEN